MSDEPEPNVPRRRPPVRLIGVGGTGCRIVAALPPDATGACEVTAMDTDSSALPALEHGARLLLGTGLLRGVGSGGSAEQAALAVQDEIGRLEEAVAGASVVFLTGALGGGTAAVVVPILAELASRAGAVVAGAVLMPFEFESESRRDQANAARQVLASTCHLRLCVSGEDLLDPGREAWGAIARGQEMLTGSMVALTEVLMGDSLVNLTLEQLQLGFAGTAPAEFARLRATGSDVLADLGRQLRNCPLLRPRVRSVRRAVAAFACGPEVGPDRMPALAARLKAALPQRAKLTIAAVPDPTLGSGLRLALWVFREDAPQARRVPAPVAAADPSAAEPAAEAVAPVEAPVAAEPADVAEARAEPEPATVADPAPGPRRGGRSPRVQETMELTAPTELDMDWEELGSRLDRPTWKRLGLTIRQVPVE